ncbi:hypothetical protein T492DRAFT_1047954 [Pavlovales sp. CCMP2436]|nr:hypothetical protein T492DRAFT_1047954 [Pavlovales sp. CCMP2436]
MLKPPRCESQSAVDAQLAAAGRVLGSATGVAKGAVTASGSGEAKGEAKASGSDEAKGEAKALRPDEAKVAGTGVTSESPDEPGAWRRWSAPANATEEAGLAMVTAGPAVVAQCSRGSRICCKKGGRSWLRDQRACTGSTFPLPWTRRSACGL